MHIYTNKHAHLLIQVNVCMLYTFGPKLMLQVQLKRNRSIAS